MKKVIQILLVLSLVLLFAGCGNNENEVTENENTSDVNEVENLEDEIANEEEEANSEGAIAVTDLAGNTVEFDQAPENIVSLTYGVLETIYALGGEAVGRPVIRGEISEQFVDVTEVGTTNDVNMEVITSLNPDLVIAHPQLNASTLPLLEDMGVNVLLTGANTIEEIKSSIEMIGNVLQEEAKATELIDEIDWKIDSLKKDDDSGLRTLIVFGVPGNWMVALPDSLSGNMLEAVGGFNIARDYPSLDKFPQYANLDTEKIVEAEPEAIFLITPADSAKVIDIFSKEMSESPVWESITAVENGNIITLPNNLFGASPGVKIVDSLDYLLGEIEAIENQ